MEKLIIIRTKEEFNDLFDHINNEEYVSFDTETDGLDKDSQVIGFSICADIEVGYYVILRYWDVKQQKLIDLETLDYAFEFMEILATKKLIMQNAPFDCTMVFNNFSVDLMPSVHTDTLILGHLLNENRHNGLKERGVELYGEDARKEQLEMKESVVKNGGVLTKKKYELYKADADLIAKYGAKDAILTLKVFYNDVEDLYAQNLDKFFYEDESMPLLRGPTYDLNTTGLKIDAEALNQLKCTLEAECIEARAYIYKEITPYVKSAYSGTSKVKTFNIGSSKQLSWLLFIKLGNEFHRLTKSGKELCKALGLQLPYTRAAKREFLQVVEQSKGAIWQKRKYNWKKKKWGNPKKVGDPWHYLGCGKVALGRYAEKYPWVAKFIEYAKNKKLLTTYVEGIQSRMQYNVIRPSFLQHGTTSGRYSSRSPNFQNLPRDDKRVKACIIPRPGNVFIGADYSQLEPRVFASVAQDERLMKCFADGKDFYSVVGAPIFDKPGLSMIKNDKDSFASLFPKLRDDAKVIALATPYGRTARQQAELMGRTEEECQQMIDKYFEEYPKVELMMLESHEQAKRDGVVYNLFGRPRRIPEAKHIVEIYGNQAHSELPYLARTLLNLGMNHKVQSTAASIVNRAAIAFKREAVRLAEQDPDWSKVKIVLQVHDELVIEGPKAIAKNIAGRLKWAMEQTITLPGVELLAEPKIGNNIAELK